MKIKIEKRWRKHSRVKCDCTHYPKDHHNREGFCDKCGCTWYWPNVKYIKRKQEEAKRSKKAKV